jgi:tRNA A-37 threonylcarbamoyl transferase component Bud32
VSRTPASDVEPPELRGYRFIKHIGSGGNAQVYLYEQDLPRRKVAVKVLNESTLSEAARHRFTAEANVTAGLAHRHIVQVFDAAVTGDGRPYIVMPYYPQPNLSVRARRSHFSVADVLRIGIQIGSAVETSHRHDVLHRDIKPQNILSDSYGEPALTDFGIATTKGGDGPEGLSVPWSPPEILYGTAPGDQRSDVYSLGATLWHLLVGRSPFEQPGGDNSTFALMGRIKSEPPPRTQRADVPDSLERLLRQVMAKEPSARPQSAMDLIRGLQSIEQELRLPLTQPILPAVEPSGDTRGGDTITRARARGGDTGFGRGRGPEPTAPGAPPTATESAQGTGGWRAGNRPPGGRPPVGRPVTDGQPPWAAAADPRTQSAPSAWSGGAAGGTVTSGWQGGGWQGGGWQGSGGQGSGGQGGAETDPTRSRGPVRVEPWGPAAGRDDDPTRVRGPVRIDPRAGGVGAGPGPRFQEPLPGERDATTMARPAALRPGDRGEHRRGAEGARPDRRRLAMAGGGVLLVAVAVGAYLMLGHGHGQATPQATATGQPTTSSQAQSALGPGASAPGEPTVTAGSAGGQQVRFRWTYANPAAGDTFRWQRVSGTAGAAGGVLAKPQLVVQLPPGKTLCVVVQVRRAGGQASEPSRPACWPN